MQVPWRSLPADTLDRLLEEIVTRDGTDYGGVEKSTMQKVTLARNQLQSGHAVLFWNAELESASLVTPQYAEAMEIAISQLDTGPA